MKKFIYPILFTILITMGAILVVQSSLINRVEAYYNDIAPEAYKNNHDDYLDVKLYSLAADRYLNKPIYSYKVIEDTYSFDLNVYHYQHLEKDKVESVIFFEIFDFKSDDETKIIEMTVNGMQSDEFAQSAIYMNQIFFHKNWFKHIFIEKDSNNEDVFRFSDTSVTTKGIKSIEIKDQESGKKLLQIDASDTPIELDNNVYVKDKQTNVFNGTASSYEVVKDFYNINSNVSEPNTENINNYNSVITKNIVIYLVAVTVLAVFVFFRKPLAEMFENRRLAKENNKKLEAEKSNE